MSTTLVFALLIPWIFWGTAMGLLLVAGRSWINLGVIPVGITVVILLVALGSSIADAFWASLILHAVLLVVFLGSYVSFLLRERKNGR